MLRAFIQIRRVLSILGILALVAAGVVSAAVPVHAAQSPRAESTPPCHHAQNIAAFDFCKARCLAAAPERFVGFAVMGHVYPAKVAASFAAVSALGPQLRRARTAPQFNHLHRRSGVFPASLKHQRLLI